MKKNFLSSLQMGTKDKQFKMMIDPELDLRLKQLAEKYGKHSGQALVEELIEIYLPVWISTNDSMKRAFQHQMQIIEAQNTKIKPDFDNGVKIAAKAKPSTKAEKNALKEEKPQARRKMKL